MDSTLQKKLDDAVWAAHSLFDRNKTSGSSANLSFLHDGVVYISQSGTCFGTLTADQFSMVTLEGEVLQGGGIFRKGKPSKEWPLHLAVYRAKPDCGAVIHVHSTYSVLWSFVPGIDPLDCIPAHTPYLKMKLGTVGLIPYAKPGSPELFAAFEERAEKSDGYLLAQHGPVVPGKNMMDAFYALEEMEESAKIAWELYRAFPDLRS